MNTKPLIYLDNNATTQLAPEVLQAMLPYLTDNFGNASSAHCLGRAARAAAAEARRHTAEFFGADETEVYFTSGGTEADNWAILSALEADANKKHIVTTRVEHEAVRVLCENLAKKYEISWIDVDEKGVFDTDELRRALRPQTALVSVMHANNETGVIFPVAELAEIVKAESDALFHVDGVNAAGKIPFNLSETKIDFYAVSGHKFHAPKGVGALLARKNAHLSTFTVGGNQENGKRAGTLAIAQIVGFGAACKYTADFGAMEKVRVLRDGLEDFILQTIEYTSLNGIKDKNQRLPNTANISFEGCEGETLAARLDDENICVSTGSACNSGGHVSSPVLRAMNTPFEKARGAIRFSLGRITKENEISRVKDVLPLIVKDLRRISGFAA